MKKIILYGAFTLIAVFGLQAQYDYFENAAGQHGDIIVGDVDNDGDLDIFMFGEMRESPHSQTGGLYINDGVGNFTKRECPAMPGWTGSADFGDINGDGFIDIIFSGHKNGGIPEANARGIALNDGTGNFTLADPANYPGNLMRSPSVAFADFNNDGLLDYMLVAPDDQRHFDWELGQDVTYFGYWTLYFQQPDGTFVEDTEQFYNHFRDQVVTVGDLDNDGDVDIFLQGYFPNDSDLPNPWGFEVNNWISAIFENDGTGQFSLKPGTELPAIGLGSHSWGDIDGNGFLDLLIVGDGFYNGNYNWDAAPWYHRVFSNNNGVFTQVFESPRARPFSWQGANLIQDLDNDGNPDVLLGGWADDIGRQKTFVFKNIGTDNELAAADFVEIALMGDALLPGLSEQDYAAADLNGDKILDYVFMGFKGGAADFPPVGVVDQTVGGIVLTPNVEGMFTPFVQLTAPQNLSATQTAVGENTKVTFTWEAPANLGAKKSVTYNLALKNTTTGKWLYNPMAQIGGANDGFRRVVKMGNAYLNKTWSLTLPQGNYEWTVQAVDGGFFGGQFAPTQVLGLGSGVEQIATFKPTVSSTNGNLVVTDTTGETLNAKVYSLAGVRLVNTHFENQLVTPLQTGAYLVEVTGKLGTFKTKVLVR